MPIPMNAKAFDENVVDYIHILEVAQAVVMTSSDESHDPLALGLFDIVDKNIMILYALAIVLCMVTIVLFTKCLLIEKETLLQRVGSIVFHLFGTLSGQG